MVWYGMVPGYGTTTSAILLVKSGVCYAMLQYGTIPYRSSFQSRFFMVWYGMVRTADRRVQAVLMTPAFIIYVGCD